MDTSVPQSTFDTAYETNTAPWVIGAPQPAIVALEQNGRISGSVLDVGCGAGEHTIYLAKRGYDVLGVDFSPLAVQAAVRNATTQGVDARFETADALDLGETPRYDTIIDSALFHVFDATDRARYVRSLHAVCRPGGTVHVLALADIEPAIGPQVSEAIIRDAFDAGWELEDLRQSRYRAVLDAEAAERFGLPVGGQADMVAWLVRLRRK